jgi:hypothetical protein
MPSSTKEGVGSRQGRPMKNPQFPGPSFRDWALGFVSLAFVVLGLLVLPRNPDVAVPAVAFFGVCGAFAVSNVHRKWRFARLARLNVEVVGGVPIRPSRAQIAMLGGTLFSLGSLLMVYWRSGPLLVAVCLVIMIGSGGFLLLGLVLGKLPVGFIQFDPEGLTIGRRRDVFTVPWGQVVGVAPAEFHDNPVLLLQIGDLNAVVVRPDSARARVIAQLNANPSMMGAHVMIFASQFGIDLPVLVAAVERYAADPNARQSLARPRLGAVV